MSATAAPSAKPPTLPCRISLPYAPLQGQKQPEVISLDAVKCDALSSLSLANYLEFVYSGCLPAFEVVSAAGGW